MDMRSIVGWQALAINLRRELYDIFLCVCVCVYVNKDARTIRNTEQGVKPGRGSQTKAEMD